MEGGAVAVEGAEADLSEELGSAQHGTSHVRISATVAEGQESIYHTGPKESKTSVTGGESLSSTLTHA